MQPSLGIDEVQINYKVCIFAMHGIINLVEQLIFTAVIKAVISHLMYMYMIYKRKKK